LQKKIGALPITQSVYNGWIQKEGAMITFPKLNFSNIHVPKLLKARQLHSRIFAVLAVALVLVSEPMRIQDPIIHLIMRWIGYVLVMIGAFGRVYCSAFIGGRKNDEVVRAGPFSVVRNPLYVFSFIAVLGVGLESCMVSMLVLLAGAFVLYYPIVVLREEAFLKNKFGAAYDTYLKEVPRWIPKFKLWNEPEQLDAKPRFIRKTAMDAALFFLPLPCFILISMMHAFHNIPVWFMLP
jgi:protein-S-isoprenylcysteine O-methyltransferase Ste14